MMNINWKTPLRFCGLDSMLNLYATRDVLLKADVDDSWIQTLHD